MKAFQKRNKTKETGVLNLQERAALAEVATRYGRDKVSQIITYGSIKAKAWRAGESDILKALESTDKVLALGHLEIDTYRGNAEIGRERYGITDEKHRRFRYGVQVNSLGLTEQQPENNVYRILLEMLAVVLSKNARARSVQLPAWNEALGLPRPWDQQWSLRLQQIVAYETDLLEYGDIFDGSAEIAKKVEALKDATLDPEYHWRQLYSKAESPPPTILFMHGGGWMLGGVDSLDYLCANLCDQLNAGVASVDYRLAPETPHPGPMQDIYSVFAWLHANAARLGLDPARYRMDDRLKEMSFGRWEGFTYPELTGREAEALAAREADKWGYVLPEGESYAQLEVRVRGWYETIDRDTVVASHGGVCRVLMAHLGILPNDMASTGNIGQGVVYVFTGADLKVVGEAA